MPRRKKAGPQPVYTILSILIDDYQAQTEIGINVHLLGTGSFGIDDEAPIHITDSRLWLSGSCTHPEERTGERYEMSLVAPTKPNPWMDRRIKDLHTRYANGSPRYAKRRGDLEPIYAEPPPVAWLKKIRGENTWSVHMWVAPQMITHGLGILASGKSVYLSIYERRISRKREVRSLSIQTTDPAEE